MAKAAWMVLVLAAVLNLTAGSARAQTDDPADRLNADIQRIHAPTTHYGFLATEAARTLGRRSFEITGATSYARNPLAYGSQRSDYLLQNLADGELILTAGVSDALDVSLALPILLLKGVNRPDATDPDGCEGHMIDEDNLNACDFVPTLYQAPSAFQLGDIRLQLRFGAEMNERHHLAFIPVLSLNTGISQTLAGSGNVLIEASGAYQFVSDQVSAGVNLGFRYYAGPQPALGVLSLGHEAMLRVGMAYSVIPLCLELLVDVVGSTVVSPLAISADRSPVEGLAGVRLRPAERMTVTMGMGTGLTSGYGASRARAFLNASWEWGDQPTTFLSSTRPNYPECCRSEQVQLVIKVPADLNQAQVYIAREEEGEVAEGALSQPATAAADAQGQVTMLPHSVRVLVRKVAPGTFYTETYEHVAGLAARPDDTVLAVTDVFPAGLAAGQISPVTLDFEWPASGDVGVYALFIEAGDDTVWRVRVDGGAQSDEAEPLPKRLELGLGQNGIDVVRVHRGWGRSDEVH